MRTGDRNKDGYAEIEAAQSLRYDVFFKSLRSSDNSKKIRVKQLTT